MMNRMVDGLNRAVASLHKASRGVHHGYRSVLLVAALALLGSSNPLSALHADVNRSSQPWIGTWATAPQAAVPGRLQTFQNQTLRLIVHTSAGGAKVRIKISNTFGDQPLMIGSAHIARPAAGADIDPASDRTLKFCGRDPRKSLHDPWR